VIRNLTPHPIRIYAVDTPDHIDDLDTGLITTIDPEETPARVATIDLSTTHYEPHGDARIPIELVEYGHVHDLPRLEVGVSLVVSLVVALSARGRSDLLVPYAEVRNTDGTVVGCRLLASPC
jgi:hypothetical protein